MPDRRTLLKGTAALALSTTLPHTVCAATHKIGAMTATVMTDGHMMVGLDRLSGDPAHATAIQTIAGGGRGTHRFSVNVTLIERDGKRILIDAGAGGTWVDTAGKLGDTLTTAGIDPASIDHVVLTHAHPDHLWGVIDDFDNSLRFPKATYWMPKAEFEFWMSPNRAEQAGAAEGVTAGARRVLKTIEPKLKLASAEGPIMPGLAYLDAKGHTPGQCAVLASSGTNHALIAADTFFHPIVSIRHPDWQPAQDMAAPEAARTRRKLLDLALTLQALVIAYHIDGAGRVTKEADGFHWRPAS